VIRSIREKERIMMRYLIFVVTLTLGLMPALGSCAEANKPARSIEIVPQDTAAPATGEDRWLEAPYGDGVDEIGFEPGGNERQTLGPAWFEVDREGGILLADPVHRKIFRLTRSPAGKPGIAAVRSLGPREGLPPAIGTPTPVVKAIKTGAESGEIVFGEGENRERVGLELGGPLASLRLVGVCRGGDAIVAVERFRELGKLAVDREILRVSRAGEIVARIPVVGAAAAPPAREFFLAPDDTLYRMVPGTDSVVFLRWVLR
jgi:hypothetical protein